MKPWRRPSIFRCLQELQVSLAFRVNYYTLRALRPASERKRGTVRQGKLRWMRLTQPYGGWW